MLKVVSGACVRIDSAAWLAVDVDVDGYWVMLESTIEFADPVNVVWIAGGGSFVVKFWVGEKGLGDCGDVVPTARVVGSEGG